MDSQGLKLPGYGLELNSPAALESFPTALDIVHIIRTSLIMPLLSSREHWMLRLIDHVMEKPSWQTKVFDASITDKWQEEALNSGEDVTPEMIEAVIQELQYKAKVWEETRTVSSLCGDVVVRSDALGRDGLLEDLRTAVKRLEDGIPMTRKDYHLESDGKVVNLVHPSLCPLVYGRSRIWTDYPIDVGSCLRHCAKGETIPIPSDSETVPSKEWTRQDSCNSENISPPHTSAAPYSQNFQWLPCDVQLLDGQVCKIASYINNLHPEDHPDLYDCLARIIGRAIPLWNVTLTPLRTGRWYRRIPLPPGEPTGHPWVYEGTPSDQSKPPIQTPEPLMEDLDDVYEWRTVQPEACPFYLPELMEHGERVDLFEEYQQKGLQVIVKLSNIELTPEKPEYGGGTWHVEGQMNEHICATALYYYSNENITESRLSFRQMTSTFYEGTGGYPQDEHQFLEDVFGLEQGHSPVQEIGSVLCHEDRLVTFPNILQHRVEPFRLQDPSRPGHRKIVALFLVDPNIRVISTANVAPQQKEWRERELLREPRALGQLPPELVSKVLDASGDSIGLNEAKEMRLKLMDERRGLSIAQTGAFENMFTFSLCEH